MRSLVLLALSLLFSDGGMVGPHWPVLRLRICFNMWTDGLDQPDSWSPRSEDGPSVGLHGLLTMPRRLLWAWLDVPVWKCLPSTSSSRLRSGCSYTNRRRRGGRRLRYHASVPRKSWQPWNFLRNQTYRHNGIQGLSLGSFSGAKCRFHGVEHSRSFWIAICKTVVFRR